MKIPPWSRAASSRAASLALLLGAGALTTGCHTLSANASSEPRVQGPVTPAVPKPAAGSGKEELKGSALQAGPVLRPAKLLREAVYANRAAVSLDKRSIGPVAPAPGDGNRFEPNTPSRWTLAAEQGRSTFSVDVDTASYTLARRYLVQQGTLPPASEVRVEEFVNYFRYHYAPPRDGAFDVHLDGAPSPFSAGHTLVRIGLQGKVLAKSQRKPAHLVFLVDTSGSMSQPDRLPLAQSSLKRLVRNLNENDTVALVTYAGEVRDVLAPIAASNVKRIDAAIDSLSAGGGTSMGSGLELAYRHAVEGVSSRSVSRVIVMTDGDTNLGPHQSAASMLASVQKYVDEGVTLSTIGFGMGNYRDDLMEKLADKGNGNCFYIDSEREARRVFEERVAGMMEVIAKDVKLQVEFNPAAVMSYRLIGYENRALADRDFRNDKVDAGEIGAGHTVTALYELELKTGTEKTLATVRVRAKAPNGGVAHEQAFPFGREQVASSLEAVSADFRFATAVAGAADVLRGNPASGGFTLAQAEKLASKSTDGMAEREEFVQLVHRARELRGEGTGAVSATR